jgi:hypothetical protein
MTSRQLIFCLTAAACIAVVTEASAETRHSGGKQTGMATGAAHAGSSAVNANKQGMSTMRGNAANRNFTAEERTGTRTGNRNFAEERTTRARGYENGRMYEGRERFAGSRGVNDNHTLVNRDRVAETRRNRTYMTAEYGGARYGRYGRTWRDRYVGAGTGVVAADVGVGYGYLGYGYGYPEYGYGYGAEYPAFGDNYGLGVGTGGLYAYAPGYGISSGAGLYDYAPAYTVRYTSRPLYSFAPAYVSRVGYSRGCSCSR